MGGCNLHSEYRPVTGATGSRTDRTRQQILRAASREFAQRPYTMVSLEDITASAGLTKGGLYFYFQSKNALAVAIIDDQLRIVREGISKRLDRRLSGLETLIETGYFIATLDIQSVQVRATLHLIEQIGRSGGLQAALFGEWSSALEAMVTQGIADGDIVEGADPKAVSRLVMSIYMGLRQTVDLDAPVDLFSSLEHAWSLMLPGLAAHDRVGYFVQFVRRCSAVAQNNVSRRERPTT
jgi:TetR/AcrR family transcriptional regulator, transcriptional repressor for nem operon